MLVHTRHLLSNPDAVEPRALLTDVLRSARELLLLPGNNFDWSPWEDAAAAVAEIDAILALLAAGGLPEHLNLTVLFAPTGPIQEVSVSSGWGETYLKVAERFDRAERLLWN